MLTCSVFSLCAALPSEYFIVNSGCQCLPGLSNQSPQFMEIARVLHPCTTCRKPWRHGDQETVGLTPLFPSSQGHCPLLIDVRCLVNHTGRGFRKYIHTQWHLKFIREVDRSAFQEITQYSSLPHHVTYLRQSLTVLKCRCRSTLRYHSTQRPSELTSIHPKRYLCHKSHHSWTC